MRVKLALALVSIVGLGMPLCTRGSVIAAYNFGPSSTSFTYAATTLAANVTASGLNSAIGANTTESTNDGVSFYASQPGPNVMSVSQSGSSTDNGYWVQMIITAAAGYVIDPSSFELFGGAGGGTTGQRSAYIFDDKDTPGFTGAPSNLNLATNAGAGPTITSNGNPYSPLASGSFTAIRNTNATMNEIQVASFPSDDVNLSEFTVRVYFDTQAGVSKNIDLGKLELDGSVVAVPEPQSVGLAFLAGAMACGIRRWRSTPVV